MGAAPKWPLVLVQWEDSHYLGVGWQGPMDFDDSTTVCESVGWLVLDGEKVKVLMPHRSVQDGALNQGGGIMQIPTRCICSMVRLGELTSLVNKFNHGPADLVVVLPITTRYKKIASHVKVAKGEAQLDEDSYIKCEEVRCISKQRLDNYWGRVTPASMRQVEDLVRVILGL
jgi:mRNA interferase MazF